MSTLEYKETAQGFILIHSTFFEIKSLVLKCALNTSSGKQTRPISGVAKEFLKSIPLLAHKNSLRPTLISECLTLNWLAAH